MKRLQMLVIGSMLLFSGCVVTTPGFHAETENNIIVQAQEDDRKFQAVISLKESQSTHIPEVMKEITKAFKEWASD